jgi:hypothetical protein
LLLPNRPVPGIFGLAFKAGGEVFRVCSLVWRNGERVGAGSVSAKELRERFEPAVADPKLQKAPTRWISAPGIKSACPKF